jgi:hypothetical protein
MNNKIVEDLCAGMMEAIRSHYLNPPDRPPSPDKVYEVLNALGICAGVILAGCNDPAADAFFYQAVQDQRTRTATDPATAAPAVSPWQQ